LSGLNSTPESAITFSLQIEMRYSVVLTTHSLLLALSSMCFLADLMPESQRHVVLGTLHPCTPHPRHRFECGSVSLEANTNQANKLAFLEQAYGFAFKALLRYALRWLLLWTFLLASDG
jgi:hypothetical protein